MPVVGAALVLGGLGHTFGITRLYLSLGMPDTNRILVDLWVGESQLLGGALFLTAFRFARIRRRWQSLAIFGAFVVIGWTVPLLPVMIARAPADFIIAPVLYLASSIWILLGALAKAPALQ
jgi:hypothetical protein